MRNLRLTALFFTLLLCCSQIFSVITENLNNAMEKYQEEEKIKVNIILKEQFDFNELYGKVRNLPIDERRETTVSILKSLAEETQQDLRLLIKGLKEEGLVTDVRYLWIINAINLRISKNTIHLLSEREDIRYLDYDEEVYMLGSTIDPEFDENSVVFNDNSGNREIAYNVLAVNAHEVWDLGFTGEGIVVSVLDTGVNYNHTDIINNMWEHPDYPHHGFNHDNNSIYTLDDHGHGTHCAGTVAGDGTSGSETGMAPDAVIMSMKVLNSSGGGSESNVWSATQFSVEYGARILSVSLGWVITGNPNRYMMRTVMGNTLAAGVIASIAAGNEGNWQGSYPIPHNLRTPGDCPPPWLHPEQTLEGGLSAVLTSGASDINNNIANFSSRGPVTWQNVPEFEDYHYNPGMGLLKPDVTAPGVDVKSLTHYSNTGYRLMSGTSMATPGTAGVMALMLSKNPYLTPEEIAQILEENSSLYPIKNNTFGSGIIDALQVINAIPDLPPENPINPNPPSNQFFVSPQTPLVWQNGGWASHYYVSLGTDNPPTNIIESFETTDLFYTPDVPLETNTGYYWRVDAANGFGVTTGETWYFITGNRISEDFETGDFSKHDWGFIHNGNSTTNWTVEEEPVSFETFSAKSGDAGANETTSLVLNLNVLEDGVISFYKRLDTPVNKFLRFYIDEQLQGQWTGQYDWSVSIFNIEAGERTLRWEYFSHNNDGVGSVWIDQISFPFNNYDCITDINLSFDNYELDFAEEFLVPLEIEFINDYDLSSLEFEIEYDPGILFFNGFETDNSILENQEITLEHLIDEGKLSIYWETDEPINEIFYNSLLYIRFLGKNDGISPLTIENFYLNNLLLLNPENGQITVSNRPELLPPAAISYKVEPGKVLLNWEEPLTDAFSPVLYNIYRDNDFLNSVDDDYLYYIDTDIEEFTNYEYSLTAVYTIMNIESDFSESINVKTLDAIDEVIPTEKNEFIGIYPNPFVWNNNTRTEPVVNLRFSIEQPGEVVFDIFNIKGQKIITLRDYVSRPGKHNITWDRKNANRSSVSQGIYLIRFNTANYQDFKKLLIFE